MGGISRFPVENFSTHSAENFHRGDTSSVSLVSGMEKIESEGWEYQSVLSKIFCLKLPKFSVGGYTLGFQQFRISKKF